RTPLYPGACRTGQVLRRHHPTASGRACPRVVDRCLADGAGDRRHRAGAATLPAGNGLTALLCSFLPSCQGAKTPLCHPGAFCAYATVVMATSVSDFRQCPVSSWFLRVDAVLVSEAAHISRSLPHQSVRKGPGTTLQR